MRALLPTQHQEHFDPDILADLNGWVIDGRYADDHLDATGDTVHHLVETASTVPRDVERLLGLMR